jgi:LysM repeat protein
VGQVLAIPERPQVVVSADVEDSRRLEYIVQFGDTLGEIAIRYRMTLAELLEANEIENPNRIIQGQVIVIPQS